jgi:hypothetical protein
VSGVVGGLVDDADGQLAEGGLAVLFRPPRDRRGRVEGKHLERLVAVLPCPVIETEEVVTRLIGGRPHVGGLRHRAVVLPGQGHRRRPAHTRTEVAELDADQVLDQAEQVGAGRNQRAAYVVLGQPLERADDIVARPLEMTLEVEGEGVRGHRRVSSW